MPASRASARPPASTRRAPRPDDLYRFRIPTSPRLAPDGRSLVCVLQTVAPGHDGYRTAIWRLALDRDGNADGEPQRLTLGHKHDGSPAFSPAGTSLAFISDRRTAVEEEPDAPKDRHDVPQVHLLPLDRPGEARRVTNLTRGVDEFAWSPDGTRLAVVSSSRTTDRKAEARARRQLEPSSNGTPPPSDYWYFDRLGYQANGAGVIHGSTTQLWVVDVASGEATKLTSLAAGVGQPAWSPDGRAIAFVTGSPRDDDLKSHARILVVDATSGAQRVIAEHPRGLFFNPTWLPDGASIAAIGGDQPHAFFRSAVWIFAADGSDARGGRDLTSRHDLMPASTMNSDLAVGEGARLHPTPDGRSLLVLAPFEGSYELWRIDVEDGAIHRLTTDRHYLSATDAVDDGGGGLLVAAIRSTATTLPDVHVGRLGKRGGLELRRVTGFNDDVTKELELREPIERWVETDAGRVQGWLIPAGAGPQPTLLQIHGGPHTLYGWTPFLEFQVLAASGISVFYSNPRGSEGYGLAFNEGNIADWGHGPMRDVIAGIDALVRDKLADPDRLGVTGGSYGGYLTSWIVGHDDRFAAAVTQRSVNDLAMLMLTGDLTGTDWPKWEFGAYSWEDPDLYREMSPITYAPNIRTPLLIQHSENDLRTTIGQAEALFAVLRRHRRPVRLMRVPGETHELTRSGTPYRRVENIVQIRNWFEHFLVQGRRRLPPMPRTKHGH